MLVLTRKKTESIRIADEIELFVLAIHGGRVRLVIHDPIPTTDLDRNLLNDLRDRVRSTVAEALNR